MKERIVDEQIRLVPYYRNDAVSLRWYQDANVRKQVDNRDMPYALALLHRMYEADKAKLVIREMTDLLVLDLVDKGLVTDQMVLTVGYDIENLTDPSRRAKYHGTVETDHYGRQIPKQAHGSIRLPKTLVGASIARPCPFLCENAFLKNALLHPVSGRPMVAPTHSIGQECDFLTC